VKKQQDLNDAIISSTGGENQYKLHEELGKVMTDNVTVVRYNDRLQATDDKIRELQERFTKISINDSNLWATQALPHARQLSNMLQLARVITLGAPNRNESRGAHYKPDFPERDDENFLKSTIAEFSGEGPVFSWEPVDIGLLPPRKRDYSKGKQEKKAPADDLQTKPKDLSGPAVWGQNKEQVRDVDHGEAATRTERGDKIEDAGGKNP